MANPNHMKKFNEGPIAWNIWRNENPSIQPDLSGANFERADLCIDMSFVLNFSNSNLEGAKFNRSELEGVDFSGSNLRNASFMWAEAIVANFDKADLRNWLSGLLPEITTGREPDLKTAVFIAFSNGGLKKLGLETGAALNADELIVPCADDNQISPGDSSPPFDMGMDHESRANILNDVRYNKPERWEWRTGQAKGDPNSSKPSADAIVLMY